ncbi:hypothetical protein FPOAC2_07622 [Fusarium poae]
MLFLQGAILWIWCLIVQWSTVECTMQRDSLQYYHKFNYDQIILFGDSIIEKSIADGDKIPMTSWLQNEYLGRRDIINRGFSGYNSSQALKVLPHILPDRASFIQVKIMVILFGANDAGYGIRKNGPNPHVPLDRYKDNMANIINYVKNHCSRIILVTPPPVEERLMAARVKEIDFEDMMWTNDHTSTYAEAIRELSRNHSVPYLDLFQDLSSAVGWKPGSPIPGSASEPENPDFRKLIIDGIHLGGPAYAIFQNGLMDVIRKNWPDQMPERLEPVFPIWDDGDAWRAL